MRTNRARAIRRLVIWYRRNAAVTTIVDTATNSASAAGNVAGTVVSSASSVVTNASSMAGNMLQPLVFDPLRRLQSSESDLTQDQLCNEDRLWVAVDGMGGDSAPGPILEGCLEAIERLPIKIKFIGELEKIEEAAQALELKEMLEEAKAAEYLEVVPSGPSVGMDEEATVVRRKRDASNNLAMD